MVWKNKEACICLCGLFLYSIVPEFLLFEVTQHIQSKPRAKKKIISGRRLNKIRTLAIETQTVICSKWLHTNGWMAMRNCTYISIFITSLRKVSPTGLQSQIFWGFIFLVQAPLLPLGWWTWCGAQTPCSLGKNSEIMIILSFAGHLSKGIPLRVLYCISTPPTYLAVVPSLYL